MSDAVSCIKLPLAASSFLLVTFYSVSGNLPLKFNTILSAMIPYYHFMSVITATCLLQLYCNKKRRSSGDIFARYVGKKAMKHTVLSPSLPLCA